MWQVRGAPAKIAGSVLWQTGLSPTTHVVVKHHRWVVGEIIVDTPMIKEQAGKVKFKYYTPKHATQEEWAFKKI